MSFAWFNTLTLEHIKLFVSSLIVVGFFLTLSQIRVARRQARANVLLKMIDDWNNLEFYEAIRYIHQVRRDWKMQEANPAKWEDLAKRWVEINAPQLGGALPDNWMKRRSVSQFLSKMGYMMKSTYITADDFFSIAPEAKRLLLVLEPIEREIAYRYARHEQAVASWDRPFNKLFFEYVEQEYDRWFLRKGKKMMEHQF